MDSTTYGTNHRTPRANTETYSRKAYWRRHTIAHQGFYMGLGYVERQRTNTMSSSSSHSSGRRTGQPCMGVSSKKRIARTNSLNEPQGTEDRLDVSWTSGTTANFMSSAHLDKSPIYKTPNQTYRLSGTNSVTDQLLCNNGDQPNRRELTQMLIQSTDNLCYAELYSPTMDKKTTSNRPVSQCSLPANLELSDGDHKIFRTKLRAVLGLSEGDNHKISGSSLQFRSPHQPTPERLHQRIRRVLSVKTQDSERTKSLPSNLIEFLSARDKNLLRKSDQSAFQPYSITHDTVSDTVSDSLTPPQSQHMSFIGKKCNSDYLCSEYKHCMPSHECLVELREIDQHSSGAYEDRFDSGTIENNKTFVSDSYDKFNTNGIHMNRTDRETQSVELQSAGSEISNACLHLQSESTDSHYSADSLWNAQCDTETIQLNGHQDKTKTLTSNNLNSSLLGNVKNSSHKQSGASNTEDNCNTQRISNNSPIEMEVSSVDDTPSSLRLSSYGFVITEKNKPSALIKPLDQENTTRNTTTPSTVLPYRELALNKNSIFSPQDPDSPTKNTGYFLQFDTPKSSRSRSRKRNSNEVSARKVKLRKSRSTPRLGANDRDVHPSKEDTTPNQNHLKNTASPSERGARPKSSSPSRRRSSSVAESISRFKLLQQRRRELMSPPPATDFMKNQTLTPNRETRKDNSNNLIQPELRSSINSTEGTEAVRQDVISSSSGYNTHTDTWSDKVSERDDTLSPDLTMISDSSQTTSQKSDQDSKHVIMQSTLFSTETKSDKGTPVSNRCLMASYQTANTVREPVEKRQSQISAPEVRCNLDSLRPPASNVTFKPQKTLTGRMKNSPKSQIPSLQISRSPTNHTHTPNSLAREKHPLSTPEKRTRPNISTLVSNTTKHLPSQIPKPSSSLQKKPLQSPINSGKDNSKIPRQRRDDNSKVPMLKAEDSSKIPKLPTKHNAPTNSKRESILAQCIIEESDTFQLKQKIAEQRTDQTREVTDTQPLQENTRIDAVKCNGEVRGDSDYPTVGDKCSSSTTQVEQCGVDSEIMALTQDGVDLKKKEGSLDQFWQGLLKRGRNSRGSSSQSLSSPNESNDLDQLVKKNILYVDKKDLDELCRYTPHIEHSEPSTSATASDDHTSTKSSSKTDFPTLNDDSEISTEIEDNLLLDNNNKPPVLEKPGCSYTNGKGSPKDQISKNSIFDSHTSCESRASLHDSSSGCEDIYSDSNKQEPVIQANFHAAGIRAPLSDENRIRSSASEQYLSDNEMLVDGSDDESSSECSVTFDNRGKIDCQGSFHSNSTYEFEISSLSESHQIEDGHEQIVELTNQIAEDRTQILASFNELQANPETTTPTNEFIRGSFSLSHQSNQRSKNSHVTSESEKDNSEVMKPANQVRNSTEPCSELTNQVTVPKETSSAFSGPYSKVRAEPVNHSSLNQSVSTPIQSPVQVTNQVDDSVVCEQDGERLAPFSDNLSNWETDKPAVTADPQIKRQAYEEDQILPTSESEARDLPTDLVSSYQSVGSTGSGWDTDTSRGTNEISVYESDYHTISSRLHVMSLDQISSKADGSPHVEIIGSSDPPCEWDKLSHEKSSSLVSSNSTIEETEVLTEDNWRLDEPDEQAIEDYTRRDIKMLDQGLASDEDTNTPKLSKQSNRKSENKRISAPTSFPSDFSTVRSGKATERFEERMKSHQETRSIKEQNTRKFAPLSATIGKFSTAFKRFQTDNSEERRDSITSLNSLKAVGVKHSTMSASFEVNSKKKIKSANTTPTEPQVASPVENKPAVVQAVKPEVGKPGRRTVNLPIDYSRMIKPLRQSTNIQGLEIERNDPKKAKPVEPDSKQSPVTKSVPHFDVDIVIKREPLPDNVTPDTFGTLPTTAITLGHQEVKVIKIETYRPGRESPSMNVWDTEVPVKDHHEKIIQPTKLHVSRACLSPANTLDRADSPPVRSEVDSSYCVMSPPRLMSPPVLDNRSKNAIISPPAISHEPISVVVRPQQNKISRKPNRSKSSENILSNKMRNSLHLDPRERELEQRRINDQMHRRRQSPPRSGVKPASSLDDLRDGNIVAQAKGLFFSSHDKNSHEHTGRESGDDLDYTRKWVEHTEPCNISQISQSSDHSPHPRQQSATKPWFMQTNPEEQIQTHRNETTDAVRSRRPLRSRGKSFPRSKSLGRQPAKMISELANFFQNEADAHKAEIMMRYDEEERTTPNHERITPVQEKITPRQMNGVRSKPVERREREQQRNERPKSSEIPNRRSASDYQIVASEYDHPHSMPSPKAPADGIDKFINLYNRQDTGSRFDSPREHRYSENLTPRSGEGTPRHRSGQASRLSPRQDRTSRQHERTVHKQSASVPTTPVDDQVDDRAQSAQAWKAWLSNDGAKSPLESKIQSAFNRHQAMSPPPTNQYAVHKQPANQQPPNKQPVNRRKSAPNNKITPWWKLQNEEAQRLKQQQISRQTAPVSPRSRQQRSRSFERELRPSFERAVEEPLMKPSQAKFNVQFNPPTVPAHSQQSSIIHDMIDNPQCYRKPVADYSSHMSQSQWEETTSPHYKQPAHSHYQSIDPVSPQQQAGYTDYRAPPRNDDDYALIVKRPQRQTPPTHREPANHQSPHHQAPPTHHESINHNQLLVEVPPAKPERAHVSQSVDNLYSHMEPSRAYEEQPYMQYPEQSHYVNKNESGFIYQYPGNHSDPYISHGQSNDTYGQNYQPYEEYHPHHDPENKKVYEPRQASFKDYKAAGRSQRPSHDPHRQPQNHTPCTNGHSQDPRYDPRYDPRHDPRIPDYPQHEDPRVKGYHTIDPRYPARTHHPEAYRQIPYQSATIERDPRYHPRETGHQYPVEPRVQVRQPNFDNPNYHDPYIHQPQLAPHNPTHREPPRDRHHEHKSRHRPKNNPSKSDKKHSDRNARSGSLPRSKKDRSKNDQTPEFVPINKVAPTVNYQPRTAHLDKPNQPYNPSTRGRPGVGVMFNPAIGATDF